MWCVTKKLIFDADNFGTNLRCRKQAGPLLELRVVPPSFHLWLSDYEEAHGTFRARKIESEEEAWLGLVSSRSVSPRAWQANIVPSLRKCEFFRAIEANRVWPAWHDPRTVVLTRPGEVALGCGDEIVRLQPWSGREKTPVFNQSPMSMETELSESHQNLWRYLSSPTEQLAAELRAQYSMPSRSVIERWLERLPTERFWSCIETSGGENRGFRAAIEAIHVLFSRFDEPKNSSPQSQRSFVRNRNQELFVLFEQENELRYRASDLFYQEATFSLRVRAVLRLFAMVWSKGRARLNHNNWLGAKIIGLSITEQIPRLEFYPTKQKASAHETIQAIQNLRIFLAETPAAGPHFTALNCSDDEDYQPLPSGARGQLEEWLPRAGGGDEAMPCHLCAHHRSGCNWNVCAAFPQGIPREIEMDRVSHDKPFAGDGGIRFEPRLANQNSNTTQQQ